jgi:hypothetical protein
MVTNWNLAEVYGYSLHFRLLLCQTSALYCTCLWQYNPFSARLTNGWTDVNMEDSTVYVVKKRTGFISCNNLRCLWGSSHRYWYVHVCLADMYQCVQKICTCLFNWYVSVSSENMYAFVQLICISMFSWYVRVCSADMCRYVQLICTCLFSWYVSVCSEDMYVFVQLICISMFSWYVRVCSADTYFQFIGVPACNRKYQGICNYTKRINLTNGSF